MSDGVERAGIQPIRERVVQEKEGDAKQLGLARALDAVSLERTEIVRVPELAAKVLENLPVAALALGAERVAKMTPQILDDGVVVQQCVVDVQQVDDVGRDLARRHPCGPS